MTIMGMEKNTVERKLRRWARDELRSGTKKKRNRAKHAVHMHWDTGVWFDAAWVRPLNDNKDVKKPIESYLRDS